MSEIWRWIGDEEVLNSFVTERSTLLLAVLILVSLAVLCKSASLMIDGAVNLARRTGLPEIVIGATIISLGTTMPEMFVSVVAAWMGKSGLALGNGVGSIICDTGLILGLTCLVAKVPVNRYILNRTGWVQVGSATLLVLIALVSYLLSEGNPILQRWVGFLFLLLLAGYLFLSYRWARQGSDAPRGEGIPSESGVGKAILLILVGLAGVIAGSRMLVPCAAEVARRVGVPDDVIAATLVAFGTSIPELITAVTAIRKGHPEITLGNIVGADVLNCLFVIGAAAAASPLAVPMTFFTFHFPAMIVILYSLRFFIYMNRDGRFKRWQGSWMLAVYLAYLLLQYCLDLGAD